MELSKIKKVYMLYHETERNNDGKLIGFFSTREKADIEKEKYIKMKGFKDFPEGKLWLSERAIIQKDLNRKL